MASVLERPQVVSSVYAGECPRGGCAGECPRGGCSATETVGTRGVEDLS